MYRQAIVTKYLPPTHSLGARIDAKAQAGRQVYAWDHALDVAENHIAAARAFAAHWGWEGEWRAGVLPSGEYCHVRGQVSFHIEEPPQCGACARIGTNDFSSPAHSPSCSKG